MPGRSRALAVALKGQQTEEALVHLTITRRSYGWSTGGHLRPGATALAPEIETAR
jgi:hypothetical protein